MDEAEKLAEVINCLIEAKIDYHVNPCIETLQEIIEHREELVKLIRERTLAQLAKREEASNG